MDTDVIVVGAGPVGLLAAIELVLGGARVRLLERLEAPSRVMKALGLGPLGIEALQRRGLAPAIDAAEARTFEAMQALASLPGAAARGRGSKFSGHFAGLTLIRRDAQAQPDRRGRPVDQQDVEAMLAARAAALGIEVLRGREVTAVEVDDDGVAVTCGAPAGSERLRAAWLVACDGGRSLVRKRAGFAFPGTPPTLTMYQAVVDLVAEPPLAAGWQRTAGGVFSYGFLPGRLAMLDFSGPPADREAPVTRAEVERVLRQVSGRDDLRVARLDSANRWTDHTRLVDTYRRGRVLLAGDAAHIHSPFGGQGLGLGLVDAANLGWKLAAVVRGERPEALLDTYTEERRPAAQAVIANTLAQLAILRPDPQAGAMRELFASLMQFDDVNRLVGETMTGLGTRYALGSARDEVGRLLDDRPLGAAGSLYALMQDGGGVLLDASAGGAASRLAAGRAARLRCVAVAGGPSMLVRPDACLAWIGEGDDVAGLDEALARWFGTAPGR